MRSADQLMRKLNYEFKHKDLLLAALTHRSVRSENNERLEFLGDSLLNFIIAEQLYRNFTSAKEGDLSRLRATLVKGETLAEIAQEFELGDFLRLGPGELKSGGFLRKSILADAFEAIIGAIYLDSNYETCQGRVLSWFESRINEIHLSIQKDPKTRLQEYLQAKHLPLPCYEILAIEGEAHAQLFHIECRVSGLAYVTSSIGPSRRKAEQLAAEKFLELLRI
ncbi:MAG: ribonuclease III [Gammaproteobacteria bacterium]|nr:ribonuclease III [Gammaproteobacteria bacterium]